MTEVKKVTPPKKTAPKATPAKKNEDVVAEDVPVVKTPEVKKEKRQFENSDDVEIMNNTTGRYGYLGRSGFALEMNEYGDITDIPFGELKKMRSEQKRHIEDAFIVILDEDVVKELRYEKLYENILDQDGVEEILLDHERLDKMLSKMPVTMRETIGAIATRKFQNEELHDTRVKKVIEKHLNIKIDA